ncbi:MAG: PepSY domain-containing protein [Planctomycetes bacterium]|nr:PepSY domain-containing protein [Planctomycetota bacterium]
MNLAILMPRYLVVACLLMPMLGSAGAPLVEDHEEDPRDLSAQATVSLTAALGTALEAVPGQAVEIELESAKTASGRTIYFDVVILTPEGKLREVAVDARSGAVIKAPDESEAREEDEDDEGDEDDEDEDEDDDEDEVRAYRRVLRHAELTLAQLVEKASLVVKGSPVEAAFETDELASCEVLFANSRYVIEVDLETRAGHITEMGLHEPDEDDDDDDEDEDD